MTPRAVQIHDVDSLGRLRRACAVAAEVLLRTGEHVAVGTTTDELDAIAHDTYIELGAYPSDLHYKGYTKSICTSVNGVIREYGGHGIGATFHADPHVSHHIDRSDDVIVVPGMTFTVEPMLTSGRPTFHRASDGWTEHADDNRPSAQFEHTVLVTETGVEILTLTGEGHSAAGTLGALHATRSSSPVQTNRTGRLRSSQPDTERASQGQSRRQGGERLDRAYHLAN
jgi:methionine aminopeptidase